MWGGCTVIIRQGSSLIPKNNRNMEVDNDKWEKKKKRKIKRHFQNMASEKLPNTDLVSKHWQYPIAFTDFKVQFFFLPLDLQRAVCNWFDFTKMCLRHFDSLLKGFSSAVFTQNLPSILRAAPGQVVQADTALPDPA